MKKTGQQTRFRDDLRRLLLFYSLLPVLSAVLLLIVFLGYIPLQNVVHGTADNLGQEWQSLQNELLSLQSQLDLDAFRSSVNYQAAVKSRIYQFINQGGSRPQFFLLDADENLVFSSQTNEAMRESLQNSFHWRLVNNLPASAGKVAMVVARAEVGVSTVSSMLVGCCLYDEKGGVGGYLYFALDEDQMAAQFKQCASDLIVTDRAQTALSWVISASCALCFATSTASPCFPKACSTFAPLPRKTAFSKFTPCRNAAASSARCCCWARWCWCFSVYSRR